MLSKEENGKNHKPCDYSGILLKRLRKTMKISYYPGNHLKRQEGYITVLHLSTETKKNYEKPVKINAMNKLKLDGS